MVARSGCAITSRHRMRPADECERSGSWVGRSDCAAGSAGSASAPDSDWRQERHDVRAGPRSVWAHHQRTASANPVLQAMHFSGGIYSAPAYWNGHLSWQRIGRRAIPDFVLNHGLVPDVPAAKSTVQIGNPGATPAVSANGNKNGIVWLLGNQSVERFPRPAGSAACFRCEQYRA